MTTTPEHPLVQRLRVLAAQSREFVIRRERTILWSGIIAFVVVFTAIAAWKIWAGAYNALDLAIYRQVAANSIRGDLFGMTIHPHSYLGDHVELFFAVLWPFYALIQHPLTLLFLQNVALALAAVPIAKIAARLLGKPWHILFALVYLANPMVQNMALFEFHMLPFAIPIISFAILAYIDQKYRHFILWSVLAMTVREDVSLVIIGFGLLALVDRRNWRWSIVPILLGGVWFIGAMKLAGELSGYGQYKFLAYYGWLGDSPGEILQTAVTKPWLIIQHVLQVPRIGLALVLLLPFAYLPLLQRRWLIPIIPIIAQIFLAGATGSVVTATHYPSLLIPFLLVAVISFFVALRQPPATGLLLRLSRERTSVIMLFSAIVLYAMFSLGPLMQSIPVIASTPVIGERVRLQQAVISSLPPGGTVAGPEDLTGLSDRPKLYSLHYVFLGKKQFSEEPYILPDDASVVLLNQRDFLTLAPLRKDPDDLSYARIRNVLSDRGFVQTAMIDRYSIFERRAGAVTDLSALYSVGPVATLVDGSTTHGSLTYGGSTASDQALSAATQEFNGQSFRVLPLDLVFTKTELSDTVYYLEYSFDQSNRTAYRVVMPLGGGIFPTSDWPIGTPVTSHFRLLIPSTLRGSTELSIRVLNLEGDIGLNDVRSAQPVYTTHEPTGPVIDLGVVRL